MSASLHRAIEDAKVKVRIVIVIALVAVVLLVFVKLNFVRADGGGGEVVWKEDAAYLFMWDCPDGFRLSILHYIMIPIQEHLHSVVIPTDRKCILNVLKVTPSGVEHFLQAPGVDVSRLTVVGEDIYADCPQGICKWTGAQFDLISKEDVEKIGGRDYLSGREFTNINGWSKRRVRGTAIYQETVHYEFTVELSKQISLLVKGSNPVFVDVLRSGQAPERIWYHEQRTRRVSKSEYEQVFGR